MVSAFAYFRAVRADKAVSTSKRVANKDAGHAGAQLVLGFIARQRGNDKRESAAKYQEYKIRDMYVKKP